MLLCAVDETFVDLGEDEHDGVLLLVRHGKAFVGQEFLVELLGC